MSAAEVLEEESRERTTDAGSLDAHKHGGYRACEYKVHHPRACRALAFFTGHGFVIARIEDELDQFLKEGERYG